MRFQDRYSPRTEGPKEAFYACLGLSEQLAQEISNAYALGTGPGTPDASGALQAGTIQAGSIVMLDPADSTWIAGTSPLVSAALPKPLYFVHEGDADLTGRQVGKLTALRGLARFLTTAVSGSSFPVNGPLIANAGNFEIKVFDDHKQIVGWVGPLGFDATNGILDVVFEACGWG